MPDLRVLPLFAALCLPASLVSAQDFLTQSATVEPDSASSDPNETLKTSADQAYRSGDYAKAIEQANAVLQKSPSDHVALYIRGSSRVEQGMQQRDVTLVRKGIADARAAIAGEGTGKPDYYLPYLFGMTNLAILEKKPAHAETARSVADQVLARSSYTNGERANILYQRGLANIQASHPENARADFAEAIKLKSDHLAAHVALCNLMNELKGPDQAVATFNQAVASLPGNPLILNNRAMHFHAMGRDDEALADFSAALKLDPKYVPALINKAFVESQTDKLNEADADLTAALEVEPRSTQALNMRGTLRIAQGRLPEAIQDYQKIRELDPKNGQAAADLGFAWFFDGKYQEALAQFDEALQLNKEINFLTPWRLAAAARIGKDLSNDPAVKASLEKEEGQRNWFDWLTAFVAGKVDEARLIGAVAPADSAVHKPQLCEAYYFVGIETARQKSADDARPFFEQAVETDAQRLSAFRGARTALREMDQDRN
jgi:tetratricopeptide (TPR) repeat protein